MKREKQQVGVIGLGRFGIVLGERLTELGHEVVALDNDPEHVKHARDLVTQVFLGDGTDPSVLQQLGFAELGHVVVSVGEAMEASILICLQLKELGVEKVWAKAVSWAHEKVLRKIGINEVFFPERYAAQQMALRITVPGLIEYMPFARGIIVQQLTVRKWAGKTLRELDLTNKYRMQVVAVKKAGDTEFGYLPRADQRLDEGDELVVLMQEETLSQITP
jgi:trk system potassium uptake protein TrkA